MKASSVPEAENHADCDNGLLLGHCGHSGRIPRMTADDRERSEQLGAMLIGYCALAELLFSIHL